MSSNTYRDQPEYRAAEVELAEIEEYLDHFGAAAGSEIPGLVEEARKHLKDLQEHLDAASQAVGALREAHGATPGDRETDDSAQPDPAQPGIAILLTLRLHRALFDLWNAYIAPFQEIARHPDLHKYAAQPEQRRVDNTAILRMFAPQTSLEEVALRDVRINVKGVISPDDIGHERVPKITPIREIRREELIESFAFFARRGKDFSKSQAERREGKYGPLSLKMRALVGVLQEDWDVTASTLREWLEGNPRQYDDQDVELSWTEEGIAIRDLNTDRTETIPTSHLRQNLKNAREQARKRGLA